MFPVLFSIGTFSITSFGLLLALGFLFGVFLVWRLARAWDLDSEKVLDLTLLTFVGGLIGARIYFVLETPRFEFSILNLILIHKYPGFSFWGGLLGGWLALFIFSKRFKIDFYQAADIASVGLLAGLIFSSFGCFLGGCGIGIQSNLIFAVSMVGAVGKRLPVQLIEALIFYFIIKRIWVEATHFHLRGKIVSLTFIAIGVVKLILLPFVQNQSYTYIFPAVLIILGLIIFYRLTKRNVASDFLSALIFMPRLFYDAKLRSVVLLTLKKEWYNQKTSFVWKIGFLVKRIKSLNVKISHKDSKYN